MANARNKCESECLVCLMPKKKKINKNTLFYSSLTKLYYKKDCECVIYCHIQCMEKWISENPVCLIWPAWNPMDNDNKCTVDSYKTE